MRTPPRSLRSRALTPFLWACLATASTTAAQGSFINWESPHVHPLEITPDGSRLLAVNTPDDRLEIFDATGDELLLLRPIPVGIDPVSVRARTAVEVWVVNHLSDTVSVIDLRTGTVRATLQTSNEPCDVVFAGTPQRAFVSCSQASEILVFDPLDLSASPAVIPVDVREPRALAVSPDGNSVYAAVFESGNGSTLLAGGDTFAGEYPPAAVDSPLGPYGGVNPPPNDGAGFNPPLNPANDPPHEMGLIVRKNAVGAWLDDNGGDWTDMVTGPLAAESGRLQGWDLPDRDLVVVDAASLSTSYVTGLMNLNMAVSVNPATSEVTVVGTDATNEIRFETNLNGTFIRTRVALVDVPGSSVSRVDLNPHLSYTVSTISQTFRNRSIGTPRAVAWRSAGDTAFVAGMGSNNLILIDATGARTGLAPTIEVGEGPTGLALDEPRDRIYVLNKFESSVSVVDLTTELELSRAPMYDPSPTAIKVGRKHLYDTHETSGLGHISCASCHVDGRTDGLAWDLGNPAGDMKSVAGQNLGAGNPLLPGPESFFDFHPMKGPMLTQTLQDIIGKEPLHWRGDKNGLEEFNGAFIGLQGDDANLSPAEMQEFEDFVATLYFPPNPFREFDNSLRTDLPLPGQFTTGKFGPAGQPLPNGDAQAGLDMFLPPNTMDGQLACATCHTTPVGIGTDYTWDGNVWIENPVGPDNEHHHMLHRRNGQGQTIKVPHLRNLYERVGFDTTQLSNRAGFGFINDGAMDSLARFMNISNFEFQSDQETADMVAFLLSFSGSDLPAGSETDLLHAPGTASQDTHAAVGHQVTVDAVLTQAEVDRIIEMITLANSGAIGLVARGRLDGEDRGFTYLTAGTWQSDVAAETHTTTQLTAMPGASGNLTVTAVPFGTQIRMGIDRDEDGFLDGDERAAASDPGDPNSVPGVCETGVPATPTGFAAVAGGAGQVALTWTDGGGDETFLAIERRPASGGPFSFLALLPANTEHFTDMGLACSQLFEYRLAARNCAGDSATTLAIGQAGACASLIGDATEISLASGGVENLTLEAGPDNANNAYFFLGSITGTSPGFPFAGLQVPLNIDPYLLLLIQNPQASPIVNAINALDTAGKGVARFVMPSGMDPIFAGLTIHHSYLVFDVQTLFPVFVSNAEAVDLIP